MRNKYDFLQIRRKSHLLFLWNRSSTYLPTNSLMSTNVTRSFHSSVCYLHQFVHVLSSVRWSYKSIGPSCYTPWKLILQELLSSFSVFVRRCLCFVKTLRPRSRGCELKSLLGSIEFPSLAIRFQGSPGRAVREDLVRHSSDHMVEAEPSGEYQDR